MIKLRVETNRQRKTISIPSSWNDINPEDLLALQSDTPKELILRLTDLRGLDQDTTLSIFEILSFLEEPEGAAYYLPQDFEPPVISVGDGTYANMELAKKTVSGSKRMYRVLPKLAKIYAPEVLAQGCAATMAVGAMVLQDLGAFLDRFKDLAGSEPTEEELEAGIENLHSFGPYASVEAIAAKYHVRPYAVWDWTAEEVYLELLYAQAKSKYADNMREIQKRQNRK